MKRAPGHGPSQKQVDDLALIKRPVSILVNVRLAIDDHVGGVAEHVCM